jgi:hypothetical protein
MSLLVSLNAQISKYLLRLKTLMDDFSNASKKSIDKLPHQRLMGVPLDAGLLHNIMQIGTWFTLRRKHSRPHKDYLVVFLL